MNCFGGNNCYWILILLLIVFCCCGNNAMPIQNECGCNRNCCCD